MARAISETTASTYDRSAAPVSPCGVPTAMNTASFFSTALARSVVKSTPRPRCFPSSSGRCSSKIGTPPCAQHFHFRFIVVNAGDAVAHFGKADRRNKSDISRPDDTDRIQILPCAGISPKLTRHVKVNGRLRFFGCSSRPAGSKINSPEARCLFCFNAGPEDGMIGRNYRLNYSWKFAAARRADRVQTFVSFAASYVCDGRTIACLQRTRGAI